MIHGWHGPLGAARQGGLVVCGSGDQVVVTEVVTPGWAVHNYAWSVFPEVESGRVDKCLPRVLKSRC